MPEILPCSRHLEKRTIVPVPKTAMNQYYGMMLRQNDVWLSGESFDVKTESESLPVKELPQPGFWLGILAPDTCHHPAAGSCINDVGHIGYTAKRTRWEAPVLSSSIIAVT